MRDSGLIRGLWRIPGQLANVGIWDTATVETLHDALTSLPLWPWMTVEVTPLSRHPLMSAER